MNIRNEIKKDKKWTNFIKNNGDHLFHEYCMLWERKIKADEMVKTHGELVASPNGFPVASPWLGVGNKCRSEIITIFKMVHGESAKPASASDGVKAAAAVRADQAVKGKFAPSAPPKLKAV